ncbi:MAG: gliding motility-associated ABC transporter substrate-binding protein GldG [Gemmatimonadaceae bacterium]|nr:gliding motility-associated ABC transporter substrate-binding protein GldG [Chitinophagaceae bacterium]
MKKLFSTKYWWIVLLLILVLVNYLSSFLHFRFDLTAEKRYTLSASTEKLLAGLDDQVNITVFLNGEMPASFTKLRNSTDELLQEFKDAGKSKLRIKFEKPGDGLDDTAKLYFLDSIAKLGIKPYTINAQIKEGEGSEQRQVVPGALISYRNRVSAVDLLSGQNSALDETSINRVEATLEYKFASAIQKITEDSLPLVGYMVGNGQPLSYNVYDLIENTLKRNYHFRIFQLDSFPTIPSVFTAMVIAKPTEKFTDEQKFKIDQYIMHGGKVLWMVDNLYAEMDSLRRTQNEFIAFDRGLNLEDLFFKYGVRINQDLVQDLNCDNISTVVGDVGGKPQIQELAWPYFPLLSNQSGHPIAKNLDYVVAQFPNSIDTVLAAGVKKTVLLSTSVRSRKLTTPAKVSWNSIQTIEDKEKFNQGNIPVAVLLEGKFTSLYANRLTSQMRDYLSALNEQFFPESNNAGKMIVIADGDLALNQVTQKDGPLAMGMSDPLLRFKYANSEFISNCVEYLTDDSGILETRGKDFTLRLLDQKELEEGKTKWQLINIIVPLLLVFLFGTVFQIIRRRSYR